jgi:hypothetical protein
MFRSGFAWYVKVPGYYVYNVLRDNAIYHFSLQQLFKRHANHELDDADFLIGIRLTVDWLRLPLG